MPKFTKTDLTDKKFNRWTAKYFVPDDSDYAKWLCVCECGNEKIVMAQHLTSGANKSCGCFWLESMKKKAIHGESSNRSPTYQSWCSMMTRSEWGHHPSAKNYKEKGIRVSKRWHNYLNFLHDMGERPENTSIDRINNSLGYSKENCRWATRHEQAMNKKNTVKVFINGDVVTLYDLCKEKNLSYGAICSRAFRRNKDHVLALRSIGIECDYVI